MSKKKKDTYAVLELNSNIMVLEEIADSITKIALAFQSIKQSRLTEDAIVTLILRQLGANEISRSGIKNVLDTAAKLDSYFLKPK